jgi:ATP-binding cassette, subfamily B, bacterial
VSDLGRPRSERLRVIAAYFRKDVRRQRRRIAAGMACAVFYALARVVEPWPLKVVFDQVLFHKPARGLLLRPFTLLGHSSTDLLATSGIALALAGVVRGISYYYEDYLLSTAAQEIVYRIRARLYRHLHRLSLSFHQRRSTGDLLVRLSSDIVLLRDVLIDSVVNLGTGAIMLVLMLAVMLAVDPVLTAVSLGVMPLILLLTTFYGRRIRVNSKQQRKREGQVAAAMHEALAAMDVVQLHGAGEREQERFADLNRRSLKQGTRAVRLEARMNRGVELALAGGTVVVLWAGTARALHGAITPGELVVFISYLRAAYRPLRRASKSVQRSAKALAAAERIVEVLDTEPDLSDSADAKEVSVFAGRIVFEQVSFRYAGGPPVLREVSLTVEPGKTLAIVGETGSGKSTLVSLVPRLFDPVEGSVRIDGEDVRAFTLDSLRAQVSVVRQESVLFGLSLAENIRYGAPDATDEEVQIAADAAGLGELAARLPGGYDTVVSERGASLSGGERQRVAIARALVRRTPILILDEPTAGLDASRQEELVDALRDLATQPTTLLVTHDLRLVRDADEIAILDRGRIAGRGSYPELLAGSPQFRRLVAAHERLGTTAPRAPRKRAPTEGPRVLFYSHNGVGVGHLQRQLDLAEAYRARHPDAAVLLATGSHAAAMFEFPDGIDFVKLPSLVMTDRYRNWAPRDLPLPLEQVVQLRSELLERAVEGFAPDLLVADFMPAGPYDELLPALDRLERRGGLAVAGFRDVIDAPAFVRELWAETGVYDVLRDRYAAICVYGDPAMVDFVADYGLDDELAARLHYCGYLGRTPRQAGDIPLYPRPYVLATCGGGADGSPLIETFVRAADPLRRTLGGTWLAVSGPLMPYQEHLRLVRLAEAHDIELRRVVPELRAHLAIADCVVSMPGYNTVCDVLSFQRPAVFMPREGPSSEQILRAERLEEWGSAQFVREPSAELLRAALDRALHDAPIPPPPVPLDGAERACDVFDHTLQRLAIN